MSAGFRTTLIAAAIGFAFGCGSQPRVVNYGCPTRDVFQTEQSLLAVVGDETQISIAPLTSGCESTPRTAIATVTRPDGSKEELPATVSWGMWPPSHLSSTWTEIAGVSFVPTISGIHQLEVTFSDGETGTGARLLVMSKPPPQEQYTVPYTCGGLARGHAGAWLCDNEYLRELGVVHRFPATSRVLVAGTVLWESTAQGMRRFVDPGNGPLVESPVGLVGSVNASLQFPTENDVVGVSSWPEQTADGRTLWRGRVQIHRLVGSALVRGESVETPLFDGYLSNDPPLIERQGPFIHVARADSVCTIQLEPAATSLPCVSLGERPLRFGPEGLWTVRGEGYHSLVSLWRWDGATWTRAGAQQIFQLFSLSGTLVRAENNQVFPHQGKAGVVLEALGLGKRWATRDLVWSVEGSRTVAVTLGAR